MIWHYQVFKVISKGGKHEPYFCIKEVFNGDSGESWTENEITAIGDSKEDLIEALKTMMKDAEHYDVKEEEVE